MAASIGQWAENTSWWTAVGLFLMLAAWETVRPERPMASTALPRWLINALLYAVSLTLLYALAPSALAGQWFGARDGTPFGWLGRAGGAWTVLIAGLLLIDLSVYAMHVAQHRVFLLWRFHAVHHADADVDISTALRHHPGEIVVNATLASFWMIGAGMPIWVPAAYGLLSRTASLFTHANVHLPAPLDRALRGVLVTPPMHRIHHAVAAEHHDTNFGNVLSIWDRLFGTYREVPAAAAGSLAYGLAEYAGAPGGAAVRPWLLPFALHRARAPEQRVPEQRVPEPALK